MSRKTNHWTARSDRAGYRYFVSQEQLAQYATLSLLERLTWLDQARRFVLLAETEQTAARRAKLRNEGVEASSSGDA